MPLQIRRVVTGHDESGHAVVQIDEISANVQSRRPGQQAVVIWSNDRVPADNMQAGDPALAIKGTSLPQGAVFRIVEYQPGVTPRNHRTNSIDYAIVLSGEIWMRLDDSEVHLRAGDVLVQRGTIHNWENRGTVPCRIAFVLIGAEPVSPAGKRLDPTG